MGICCGCTSAGVLMDEFFYVPASADTVRKYLLAPESWVKIIPGAKQAGDKASVRKGKVRSYPLTNPDMPSLERARGGGCWPDVRTLILSCVGCVFVVCLLCYSCYDQNLDFVIAYPGYEVFIQDVKEEEKAGAISYRVSLGSDSSPDGTFEVRWTFHAEPPPGQGTLKQYGSSGQQQQAPQEGGGGDAGGGSGGTFVRRCITNFQAHRNLCLPWTLGLRDACQKENGNIVEAHETKTSVVAAT